MNRDNIEQMRKEYTAGVLHLTDVDKNPFTQFGQWFNAAINEGMPEPSAMNLATVGENGRPSARIVLLKGFDEQGFVFYTNYNSKKGKQLQANPFAALTFHWVPMERQIRIEGKIEKVDADTSTRYFQSRPKESQLGALVSPQSEVIASREALESEWESKREEFKEVEVLPRPENWGGFRLIPDYIEFWQGRRSRLHDRIVYRLGADNLWHLERLAP